MCRLNNFNVKTFFLCFDNFWASQYDITFVKKVGCYEPRWFGKLNCFIWSILPWRQSPIFIWMSKQWLHNYSLSGYLSLPTRVGTTQLYYFWKVIFRFEFETANQPGFEPWSAGLKPATLTIELHSINHYFWLL